MDAAATAGNIASTDAIPRMLMRASPCLKEVKLSLGEIDDCSIRAQDVDAQKSDDFAATGRVGEETQIQTQIVKIDTRFVSAGHSECCSLSRERSRALCQCLPRKQANDPEVTCCLPF